ncbi:hypothetical protein LDG_7256 [Legionella drancourtii LLAP12]|uniref:Uncharacterized protein n=1 Tax=Legionella drancourtii LLAP12 TaxID=658187 RepID=G9EPR7_9GAMM|nr:hypothetical protein LDG_7256 [Legionella drancourtii LLAP12]
MSEQEIQANQQITFLLDIAQDTQYLFQPKTAVINYELWKHFKYCILA